METLNNQTDYSLKRLLMSIEEFTDYQNTECINDLTELVNNLSYLSNKVSALNTCREQYLNASNEKEKAECLTVLLDRTGGLSGFTEDYLTELRFNVGMVNKLLMEVLIYKAESAEKKERDLKNQAYYFILEKGYSNDFAEYSRKNPIGQTHQEKIAQIADLLQELPQRNLTY